MATYMTFAASNTLSSFLSLTKVLSSKGFVNIMLELMVAHKLLSTQVLNLAS